MIKLYYAAFNAIPDASVFANWIGELRNGSSFGEISAGIVASAKFQAIFDTSLSDEGFWDQLYQTALGSEADANSTGISEAGELISLDELFG